MSLRLLFFICILLRILPCITAEHDWIITVKYESKLPQNYLQVPNDQAVNAQAQPLDAEVPGNPALPPMVEIHRGADQEQTSVTLLGKTKQSITYQSLSGKAHVNQDFKLAFYEKTCVQGGLPEGSPYYVSGYNDRFTYPTFRWNHAPVYDEGAINLERVLCIVIYNRIQTPYIRQAPARQDVMNWHATVGKYFDRYLTGGGFSQFICDLYGRLCYGGLKYSNNNNEEALREVKVSSVPGQIQNSLLDQEAGYLWPLGKDKADMSQERSKGSEPANMCKNGKCYL